MAVQIVRVQIDYDGTSQIMDLELFDDIAGPSVRDFLNYDGINCRRYDAKTVICRWLRDGQRGGEDLTVNGSILNNASGLNIASNPVDSSSGSIPCLQFFIYFTFIKV